MLFKSIQQQLLNLVRPTRQLLNVILQLCRFTISGLALTNNIYTHDILQSKDAFRNCPAAGTWVGLKLFKKYSLEDGQ